MGNFITNFSNSTNSKQFKIFLIGVEATGKTALLYRLVNGKFFETIPTFGGFNIELIEQGGHKFQLYDCASRWINYVICNQYYENTDAIIFVIDSKNRYLIDEEKLQLEKIFKDQDHLKDVPILIFSNKQDLNVASDSDNVQPLSTIDLIEQLDIENINVYSKKWHIQPCSVLTNEGIDKGLQWLQLMLENTISIDSQKKK